jgi:hypothetical protein
MAMLVPVSTEYGICVAGFAHPAAATHGPSTRGRPTTHHACLAPAACSWPDRQAPQEELVEHHR